MGIQVDVLTLDELSTWVKAGPAPVDFSPLGENQVLVLSLEDCEPEDARRFADWLRALICPVIGIGNAADGLAGACDVLATDGAEASMLVEKVHANPIAASTLVEVLRITEQMPLEKALRVESLAYAVLQGGPEYAVWLQDLESQQEVATDEGPAVIMNRDGGLLKLELNRPSNRNAMSVEMRDSLNEALQLAVLDDSVEQIEISGRGKCFSTGGDLAEFGTVPDVATGHMVRGLSVPGALLARVAEKATAHVHGACIGSGVEFPMFAGRVAAKEGTHFQLPEVAMGLIPGAGGCVSVARRIGRQRCAWLAITGKRIRVQQALEWGLVDEITG